MDIIHCGRMIKLKVTKRNGKIVEFDKNKIKMAVLKAFLETDGEETAFAKEKSREISNYVESLNKDMNVEEIQDIIVNKLMASSRKDVATKYVEYRFHCLNDYSLPYQTYNNQGHTAS